MMLETSKSLKIKTALFLRVLALFIFFPLSANSSENSSEIARVKIHQGYVLYKNTSTGSAPETVTLKRQWYSSIYLWDHTLEGGIIKDYSGKFSLECIGDGKKLIEQDIKPGTAINKLCMPTRRAGTTSSEKSLFECNHVLRNSINIVQVPYVFSPRYTFVFNPRPQIIWNPVVDANSYTINLYANQPHSATDTAIWSEPLELPAESLIVQEYFGARMLSVVYPQSEKELSFDQNYRFEVIANLKDGTEVSSQQEQQLWNKLFRECFNSYNGLSELRVKRKLLDPELEARITNLNSLDKAILLSEKGFYSDSLKILIEQYNTSIESAIYAIRAHQILGRMYRKTNLAVPAFTVYQRLYCMTANKPNFRQENRFSLGKLEQISPDLPIDQRTSSCDFWLQDMMTSQ